MKFQNSLLSILILFTSLNQLSASTGEIKIIENPSYEITRSGIYHISKIELSERETRVHIHCTYTPNWWINFSEEIFLRDSETREKYSIEAIEGAKFGEKVYMPDSGETTIVLIFPALNKNTAKIDYNNIIYGISLDENETRKKESSEIPIKISQWLEDELALVTKEPLENLNSEGFFSRDKARLIGYIKGYDVRLGFTTGIFYSSNGITNEDYPVVIEIHPDGRFEAEIPLIHPIYSKFTINSKWIPFYLEPGQTLGVILNWEEFLMADRQPNERHRFKDIRYQGELKMVNVDLLGFDFKNMDYSIFSEKIKNITPEDFVKDQLVFQENNADRLEEYLKTDTISEKAAVILKGINILESSTKLFNFVMYREHARRQDTISEILKSPVPDDYYDFLNNIPLNDQSLLALGDFSTFINRFEFSKPLSIYPKVKITQRKDVQPEKQLLEYLDDKKIRITEQERNFMEQLQNNPSQEFKNENAEQLKLFSENYKDEIEAYTEEFVKPLIPNKKPMANMDLMQKWKLRDSVLTHQLGLKNDLVYDITKIRSLKFDISRANSENAYDYWKELQQTIENQFLKAEGERLINKAFPIIKKNTSLDIKNIASKPIKSNATPLPLGKATTIFKEILDPYKGKIVFVDFWATTCGPCVATIKKMKETRKKYKGNNDFEFVFITDERLSPLSSYTKLVNDQELENIYRIPTDDYNYLRQLFKFNGIPRYVVMDKNGRLIDGNFSMHSFNNELQDILKEYK